MDARNAQKGAQRAAVNVAVKAVASAAMATAAVAVVAVAATASVATVHPVPKARNVALAPTVQSGPNARHALKANAAHAARWVPALKAAQNATTKAAVVVARALKASRAASGLNVVSAVKAAVPHATASSVQRCLVLQKWK